MASGQKRTAADCISSHFFLHEKKNEDEEEKKRWCVPSTGSISTTHTHTNGHTHLFIYDFQFLTSDGCGYFLFSWWVLWICVQFYGRTCSFTSLPFAKWLGLCSTRSCASYMYRFIWATPTYTCYHSPTHTHTHNSNVILRWRTEHTNWTCRARGKKQINKFRLALNDLLVSFGSLITCVICLDGDDGKGISEINKKIKNCISILCYIHFIGMQAYARVCLLMRTHIPIGDRLGVPRTRTAHVFFFLLFSSFDINIYWKTLNAINLQTEEAHTEHKSSDAKADKRQKSVPEYRRFWKPARSTDDF